MALPPPINFAASAPNYPGYYNQGAKAVQDTVDSFYHNAEQQRLLEEGRRRLQLQEQLAPLKLQEQKYRVANLAPMTPAVDPADAGGAKTDNPPPFNFNLGATPPPWEQILKTAAQAASSSPAAANAMAQKTAAASSAPQLFDTLPGNFVGPRRFVVNPRSRQYLPVPRVSRSQQIEDRQLVANAGRLGINAADYPTDAAGNLSAEGRQGLQSAYAAARLKTAGDGLTENQRLTHEERARRLELASQPRPAKPVYDSWKRFNDDLHSMYGHGLGEFKDTGAEDTHEEDGGIAYYMGGADGAPKERVFLPHDEHQAFVDRYNAIKSGNPTILNQSAIDAAAGTQKGAGGASGAPNTSAAPSPTAAAAGDDAASVLEQARAAIQAGADAQAVKDRLEANGIDSGDL